MTKTIIPFCVNAKEENLTEEQIRQLHAWCVEAGAKNEESVNYWLSGMRDYYYIGVDHNDETLSHNCQYINHHFDDNVIKFKDVRKHLGLDSEYSISEDDTNPPPTEHTHSTIPADVVIDKQTLVEYANILSSDITICQDGNYRVFVEAFEKDVILKSDQELHDFVKAYQELKKFVE